MTVSKQTLWNLVIPTTLGITSFLLYVHNLSSSVYGGDSGDFLSAIAVKGVAHPSGYPLYTLLGILINLLPVHQSLAWKVDLLSAFFASGSVVLFYAISCELIPSKLIAICTALTLAFLYPFWLFAEMAEVFALYHFFLILLFYCGLLLYTRRQIRYGYLLIFFLGLSLTNHELTLLFLPSLLIFFFATIKQVELSLSFLASCVVLFVVGLLPYIYIPLSALHNPPINWDHASNIGNFLILVTRGDYTWGRSIGPASIAAHLLALQNYQLYLFSEFPLLLVVSLIGGLFVMLWRKKFVILLAIVVAFLLFGPVFIFYGYGISADAFSKGIEEKFYTSSMIFLLLFFPYTIDFFSKQVTKLLSFVSEAAHSRPFYPTLFACIFFVIPYVLFAKNSSLTNLQKITIGDKLGYDILSPLPSQSYLIIKGDNISFNTLYMHYGQHIRPDVFLPATDTVTRLVKQQVKRQKIPTDINPHDPALSTVALLRTFSSGVRNTNIFASVNDYAVYVQQGETALMPYGLVEKLATPSEQAMDKDTFLKQQNMIFNKIEKSPYTMPSPLAISRDWLIAEIPEAYAIAYANTGYYLLVHYNDSDYAKRYFDKAISLYPDTAIAYEGLGDYYMQTNKCEKAKDVYTKATTIDFLNDRVYGKLYNVVSNCLHDEKRTNELKIFFNEYPTIFGNILHPLNNINGNY